MKTEDELLDLIAQTHINHDIGHIKEYLAENVVYDNEWSELPVIGKENACAKIQHWFQYHRDFSVWVDAIRYSATEESMGYVSLEEDYSESFTYVIIESEGGLITRYYKVKPGNTGRHSFQTLKNKYFEPRLVNILNDIK